jgi:S1-C subfamily serine protease/regulator of sirC expression with transglutaminase-like and TPR domain
MPRRILVLGPLLLLVVSTTRAADEPSKTEPDKAKQTVEQLAATVNKSVVVITITGRDGKRAGLGTGFVVGADGLIATNLHVIGEARPISVQLADGKKFDVTSIHATDRSLDLALVRIDAKGLTPLDLGDSDQLKQGTSVVALGNPLGLERSVVSGVVSGRRDIEGQSMLQLAMPTEPGNSGGPVVDLQGRVQGIITLKSALTANLGFAMPVNALKPLIAKPNPVAMARWLTIGTLDADEWEPLFGANWRQRAGRITVESAGNGFGGRSLCLAKAEPPALPYEVAVAVKLDDEAGAAGLTFFSDGKDKHYGFYPSGGGLRLTRFDGPDVLSWKIIRNERSPHYHPGEWNTLKVSLTKDKVRCFVNDQLVFETDDVAPAGTRVGLAKFRETRAEFKHFQAAREVVTATIASEIKTRVLKVLPSTVEAALKPDLADTLAPEGDAGVTLLRERARLLEQQAAQLKQLAESVHQKRVQAELVKVLAARDEDADLLNAALLVARLDNEELDVEAYRREVERIAKKIAAGLPKGANDKAKVEALNQYLFTERGFHGSRGDYYNRANSYLNEVLDDREGLPITLSVLYMELARRIGLRTVGVGLPGHFVVRTAPAEGEGQLIDVYEGGKLLSREDADKKVRSITGRPLEENQLRPTSSRAIVVRMLHNLLGIARGEQDAGAALRYLDAIVALDTGAAGDRWMRAVLRAQGGQKSAALTDVEWLLDHPTDEVDRDQVLEFRRLLQRRDD